MPSHDLLRSQRNELLLRIQKAGFDATEFRWQEATSRQTQNLKVPQLLHEASRYYYRFDLKDSNHYCEYSPGVETLSQSRYPGDWKTQAEYFGQWLSHLRREVEAPDLWSNVAEQNAMFGVQTAEDNTPFSSAEKAKIAASVQEIKRYVEATHSPDQDRIAFIDERLEYLVESSERLGRKDWRVLALGTLTNIVVGAALAPDAARDLLRIAGAALGWLFGGSPLLPHSLQ